MKPFDGNMHLPFTILKHTANTNTAYLMKFPVTHFLRKCISPTCLHKVKCIMIRK